MNDVCCARPGARDPYRMPEHPDWPGLRAGTQLDAIYERLMENGSGFVRPGLAGGLPKAVVVLDPQCSWSHVLWNTILPLQDMVEFHFFPVGVSQDYSTAQAAAILASATPWELMREHQELFEDPDFRGLHAERYRISQQDRDNVWENSRIYRRGGGTNVPLGIYRDAQGRFVPFFGPSTLTEIRAILGV